jgi:hypothetical protein
MADNNEIDKGLKDELLAIALSKISESENNSYDKRWKSLDRHFIDNGAWEKSLLEKIFYWPTNTVDRMLSIFKTFIAVMLGIGIATIQMNYVLTRGGSEKEVHSQSYREDVKFSSEITRENVSNPLEFSQQIILSAMKDGLTTEVKQSGSQSITLVIFNLEKNKHIPLKAILSLPPQFYGNIKVTIDD